MDAERAPLLETKRRTPLPATQLFIACLAFGVEFVAFNQIFPYINQMVEDLHIADRPEDVGFYSGLIDGLFSLASVIAVFRWSSLSDRIGRRPVVLAGLLGLIPSTLCFGLSTKLWQLVLSRAIAGLLCGNRPVIRSWVAEITDETNQATAFPMLMGAVYFGQVFGPVLGSIPPYPARWGPSWLSRITVLRDHPFALPSIVSASLVALTFFLLFAMMVESRATSAANRRCDETMACGAAVSRAPSPQARTESDLRALLSDRQVIRYLLTLFLFSFNSGCFDAVLLLFCYTPIRLGGLERDPSSIGTALAISGLLGIAGAIAAYPWLDQRFGAMNIYVWAVMCWPAVFLCFPVVSVLVHKVATSGTSVHIEPLIWSAIIALLILGRFGNLAWAADGLVAKSIRKDELLLGQLFGICTAVLMLGQGLGPYFVSSLFALSIDRQILGGHLVWLVMICMAFLGVWSARSLRSSART